MGVKRSLDSATADERFAHPTAVQAAIASATGAHFL